MDTQPGASTKMLTVNIDGMACSGCATTVKTVISQLEGVTEAKVKLENGSASVTFDNDAISIDDFKQAIEDAGYEFKGIKK